ncbi:malate dehydrogenase 3, cytoplasmic-like [Photinus pyralis]|uniref:malate dehydrogenase 3, cytoplasmic-like n=1 Tax=Photinus pyralis TaxID=7054 RepID=UPI001266FCD6|nr:malate dehydrogenase 3, cytoplasmic-like [Photinus pyralis]
MLHNRAIKKAADFTGLNLSNIGGPPVWGYVGVNQFIDVKSAIVYSDMYRPYQRALKNKGGSTLPLGTVHPELRFLSYLIEDANEINIESIESRRTAQQLLNRHLVYSKVRATISVIKIWYAKEPTGDIISLGICSNGSFGIPAGLVFSQPSILKNNVWVPYEAFPTMEETKREILKLIDSSEEIHHLMDCVAPTSAAAY